MDPRLKDAPFWDVPAIVTPERAYARTVPPDVLGRQRLSPAAPARSVGAIGVAPEIRGDKMVELPPWQYAPFGATMFDEPMNRIPANLGVGASTTFALSFGKIPAGSIGVIWAIGFQTSDATNTSISTRKDGTVVPPWGGLVGAIGSLDNPTRLVAPIFIEPGVTFDLLVTNNGAAIITVAARIMGWYYSK